MKIVLLLVGVLLLAGAGVGGYLMYSEMMPDVAAAEEPEPVVPMGPPAFLKLKPLTVPVIGRRGVEQFITLDITLEVVDKATADDVTTKMPRIVDAFLTTLYGEIDRGSVVDGTLVKVDAVKQKLNSTAAKLFGNDVITDVLIQSIQQRRL